MRELYLLGCLVLGAGAVVATLSVVKYDYKNSPRIPEDISFASLEEEEKPEKDIKQYQVDVIHERNAFSQLRGKAEPVGEVVPDTPPVVQAKYSFELRGINVVGDKKVALLTAQPIRTSRSSSSRSSGRTVSPVTSRSNTVHIVPVGEEIEDSGHKVKSIEGRKVVVVDGEGKELPPLIFSLVSEDSIKRGELAYKNEVSRQKYFSKQNEFPDATKQPAVAAQPVNNTPKPVDPRSMTKEEREEEMRRRAENLKAEMKRLKELRESAENKSKDYDDKKDHDKKNYDKKDYEKRDKR